MLLKKIDSKARFSITDPPKKIKHLKVSFSDMFCGNITASGKFALQHLIDFSGYNLLQHSALGYFVCVTWQSHSDAESAVIAETRFAPSLKVVTEAGGALQT